MLLQGTALASEALRIGATLRIDYGIDPAPLFAASGIDADACARPGERLEHAVIGDFWQRALARADDGEFGLKLGRAARAADFFVLGHAWSASDTLLDAIERMIRYGKVVTSPFSVTTVEKVGDVYRIAEAFDPALSEVIQPEVSDSAVAGLLALCSEALREPAVPVRVALVPPESHRRPLHRELLGEHIEWGASENVVDLPAELLERPLTGAVPAVAEASDRIAVGYIDDFERGTTATEVRRLLVRMLPSGHASQDRIASQMHRSASTLQRQLNAEGTNFRSLLRETRKGLAEQYLQDGRHSQAEIAFMVGFSDQSNFARAFRRWTGMSPGEFRSAA
jgi:AraC-like DNA-binding protein